MAAELTLLADLGRRRALPRLEGPSRVEVTIGGQNLVCFCSNDYLGLACHPDVVAAASEAAGRSGIGAGAARLVSGDLPDHRALELALASLIRLPSALLFPTGYQANVGLISSLAGPADLIVADRAVHASLIDGCRLSGAKLAFYPHLRLDKAKHHLARLGPKARRRFLVTESLFSMDGDAAPLADLSALAREHEASLIVDEAHALGILGPGGAGLCAQASVVPDALIGTLGKAFGCAGAFVAGDAILRDVLINRARTFIFTTALPPVVAAAALRAVEIARSGLGDDLRTRLVAHILDFRSRLGLPPDPLPSPILPIIVGADHDAVRASQGLRALGLLVQAIRPPTVRDGAARLRLTFSAAHKPEQIARLSQAVRPLILSSGASPTSSHPAASSSSHPSPPSPPSPLPTPAVPRGVFIAGTDTGVGKTQVAAGLLALFAERGLRPVPFKPVETGAEPSPQDAERLRQAAGRADLPLTIVCPYPLRLPVAPAAAAPLEKVEITAPMLQDHLAAAARLGDLVVVESAGGLLSPYAPGLTGADLAEHFGLPVLLVAKNGLGTINHTALAIAEIRRRNLPVLGIVLVNVAAGHSPDHEFNADLIADVTGIRPLGVLRYLPTLEPRAIAAELAACLDFESLAAKILR